MTLRPAQAKWFELLTTREELAAVVEALARSGAVELETFSRPSERLFPADLETALAEFAEIERRYRAYWPETPDQPAAPTGAPERLVADGMAALAGWRAEADPLIDRIERLTAEARGLETLRALLENCAEPLPDLEQLGRCGPDLAARLYLLPPDAPVATLPELTLHTRIRRPEGDFLLALGPAADIAALDEQFAAAKARTTPIPEDLPAKAPDAARETAARIERLQGEIAAAETTLAALAERFDLARVCGRIRLIAWLTREAGDLSATPDLAWVTGWTSAEDAEAFCAPLQRSDLRCVVNFADPPEGAEAPSLLRNPPWARAFEALTRLLGAPGRDEADPSMIVAVVAPLLFGFMFGDVGQGAVLLLAGLLLRRRMPLLGLLIPGGIMAMVFGALYGDVFTREDVIEPLWLRPLEEPIAVLAVSVAMGIAVLLVGLALNAAQAHWRGAGRIWWARDAGLLLAYLAILAAPFRPETLWAALAGGLWFVIGGALVGRGGALARLVAGIAELAEGGLQLLVATVSFARVGAFALAHAGLSVAVAELAESVGGPGFWIILLLGNLLILTLEALIVGVQTTRLLLFEFFVRFLAGEGRGFNPLRPPGPAPSAAAKEAS